MSFTPTQYATMLYYYGVARGNVKRTATLYRRFVEEEPDQGVSKRLPPYAVFLYLHKSLSMGVIDEIPKGNPDQIDTYQDEIERDHAVVSIWSNRDHCTPRQYMTLIYYFGVAKGDPKHAAILYRKYIGQLPVVGGFSKRLPPYSLFLELHKSLSTGVVPDSFQNTNILKQRYNTTIQRCCVTYCIQDESREEGYECDECNNKFTGFVYECVQCTHRMCGACDALGCHKHHYVLRIPPHSSKSEAELVRAKVRLALAEAAPEPRAGSDTDGAEPWEPPVELKMEFEPDECDPLSTLDPRPPDPARASWTQTLGNITVKVESEDLEPSTSGFSVPSVTPSISSLTPSMLQTTTAHSLTSNRLQNLTQASHSTHTDIPASSANILVPHMATIGARYLGGEMKGTASGGGKRLVVDDRTPKRGRPLKRDIRPRV